MFTLLQRFMRGGGKALPLARVGHHSAEKSAKVGESFFSGLGLEMR
jgi:hypothetical protein